MGQVVRKILLEFGRCTVRRHGGVDVVLVVDRIVHPDHVPVDIDDDADEDEDDEHGVVDTIVLSTRGSSRACFTTICSTPLARFTNRAVSVRVNNSASKSVTRSTWFRVEFRVWFRV